LSGHISLRVFSYLAVSSILLRLLEITLALPWFCEWGEVLTRYVHSI